ncbi:unnamed protein product [Fraxinus pennsylvanica]|uniref:Conserved oligomeric Golgi complex subunit 4 N-terminal domain-containing protein n=1 Tax=Fraxinus pennsylvanica TaxID=56036 RepID=A0AAD1ZBQ2_9LAMI|nr:unnamed protein product [Fraxinus pennsylvanica]
MPFPWKKMRSTRIFQLINDHFRNIQIRHGDSSLKIESVSHIPMLETPKPEPDDDTSTNAVAVNSAAVSAKVHHLDLAQSRVNDTLLRIDAIVDSSSCLDGVRKLLQSEDFESAASYIQTFLQIDAKRLHLISGSNSSPTRSNWKALPRRCSRLL